MKKRWICFIALCSIVLLAACSKEGGPGAGFPFRQEETQSEEPETASVQEEVSVPDETSQEESSRPESGPVSNESQEQTQEEQEERPRAKEIGTSTETGEIPLIDPESKILYQIKEEEDGTFSSWILYHYEEDVLSFTEDTLQDVITHYDAERRELLIENSAGEVEEEYRYDAEGSITYLMSAYEITETFLDHDGNMVYAITQEAGQAVTYDLDEQGRITSAHVDSPEQAYDLAFRYSEDWLHLDVYKQTDGEEQPFAEIEYDGKGHIIQEIVYTAEGVETTTTEYTDAGKRAMQLIEIDGRLSRRTVYTYDDHGFLQSNVMEWGNGSSAVLENTRDADGKVLAWERIWTEADGSERRRIKQVNEYNDRGDVVRSFWIRTAAESEANRKVTTYYLYDYDEIDPETDESYRVEWPEDFS
ncbi:MAG: hypothetical protein IJ917_03555 [Firmicutes bacterium]|nr:hypothetical protein [Bacillota bacterium]